MDIKKYNYSFNYMGVILLNFNSSVWLMNIYLLIWYNYMIKKKLSKFFVKNKLFHFIRIIFKAKINMFQMIIKEKLKAKNFFNLKA